MRLDHPHRRTVLLLLALAALAAAAAGPATAEGNVTYNYIDHENYGVENTETQMIMEITNNGNKKITDDIKYKVSVYAGATPEKKPLTLKPGESKIVKLQTGLLGGLSNYQVWTIEYNGVEYRPPQPGDPNPLYNINETILISKLDENRGSGGDFEIVRVEQPNSIVAGEPIPVTVTVDNSGNQSATQTLNLSGAGGNDSRAITVKKGEQTKVGLSVCSPDNASDKTEITVETANDSQSTNVSISPGDSRPCKFGYTIPQTNANGPVPFGLDGDLPVSPRQILIGFGILIVLRLLLLN